MLKQVWARFRADSQTQEVAVEPAGEPVAIPLSLVEWNAEAYRTHVRELVATHDLDEAMALAVGGDWAETGALLVGALMLGGLSEAKAIVDVGCGAGRLAVHLAQFFPGHYLGIDIVEDLVSYAASKIDRDDFCFQLSDGLSIPAETESADIVCFFSVFTHLPHEAIYAYLREARRILRPGGTIVASFLEFADPALWPVFDSMVENLSASHHHNQFVHRDDLHVFCSHLSLETVLEVGATEQIIPISAGLAPTGEVRHFGQALVILRRPFEDGLSDE